MKDNEKYFPTDEKLQEWGEEHADQYFERSDKPISEWWLTAEAFTNGGRTVIEYISKQLGQSHDRFLGNGINWVAFDCDKVETHPTKYGKYLITRKDGKIHWETWNGSGWAYNEKVIRYWAEIKPPCLQRV